MIKSYLFWTVTFTGILLLSYKYYQMTVLGGMVPIDNFTFALISISGSSLAANKSLSRFIVYQQYLLNKKEER